LEINLDERVVSKFIDDFVFNPEDAIARLLKHVHDEVFSAIAREGIDF